MNSTFDRLSLTNSRDITCNTINLVINNDVKNILDIFALKDTITSITGLPPETLNTLEKLADALGDRPDFFNYVSSQLALKRNISDSYDKSFIDSLIAGYYTQTQTNNLLNNKLDSSIINNYYTKTQTSNLFTTKDTFNANISNY